MLEHSFCLGVTLKISRILAIMSIFMIKKVLARSNLGNGATPDAPFKIIQPCLCQNLTETADIKVVIIVSGSANTSLILY